jgi:hypothetical protein
MLWQRLRGRQAAARLLHVRHFFVLAAAVAVAAITVAASAGVRLARVRHFFCCLWRRCCSRGRRC